MKAFVIGAILVIAALVFCACGAAPTPTPAPTAAPTPVLATRVEDIVGTWVGIGFEKLYQRFNADGTCQVGITLEGLNKPDAFQTLRVEGTRFIFTEVESLVLDPCPANAKTGIYEVQLLPNGNILFRPIEDLCGKRRRSMGLEHEPVH